MTHFKLERFNKAQREALAHAAKWFDEEYARMASHEPHRGGGGAIVAGPKEGIADACAALREIAAGNTSPMHSAWGKKKGAP